MADPNAGSMGAVKVASAGLDEVVPARDLSNTLTPFWGVARVPDFQSVESGFNQWLDEGLEPS